MFRFTIRDVLWLTVLVGVLVAWWLDRTRLESLLEYAIKKLEVQNSILTGGTLPPDIWTLPQR